MEEKCVSPSSRLAIDRKGASHRISLGLLPRVENGDNGTLVRKQR